jgi:NitT/TauT family transport system substrate-binding protein
MKTYRYTSILFCLVLIAVLAACSSPTTPVQQAAPVTLKMALLPIVDNLPMYVAQQEGLFDKHGVQVKLIPVASAAERDQVFAAGQADGLINEIISTQLYNRDQIQLQIVRFARTATPSNAEYHILVAADSGIDTPQGLKGVDIGVSEGTIIEYITDRLLEAEGLAPEDIKTLAVPKIPDRMALLSSGELKAATLPDPLSFLAVQQGAIILLDDTKHPQFGHSTYAFRKTLIDQNPQAIKAFLAAIEEAVDQINADPQKWKNLLTSQNLLPASLVESYQVPPFPTAGVPDQTLWDDVLAWTKDKKLVDSDVSYQDSVNPNLLP